MPHFSLPVMLPGLSQSEVPDEPPLHQLCMYSSIFLLRFWTRLWGSTIDEIWI